MSPNDVAAWLLILGIAVGSVAALLRGRPGLSLGILFVGSSLSLITAPLLGAGVRVEQPAIAGLALVIVGSFRPTLVEILRAGRWPILLALMYLGANVASAILMAPDRSQSLKICLWLAISLVGAVEAATLIRLARTSIPDRELILGVIGLACLQSVVAILQVAAELGIQSNWGVLRSDAAVGKAFGLAWEPNLLAINLAAALLLLVDPQDRGGLSRRNRRGACVLIGIGIALSLSRGGIIAAIGGAAILAIGLVAGRVTPANRLAFLRDAGLAIAIAVGGYGALSALNANGFGARPGEVPQSADQPQGTLVPIAPQASASVASPRAAPSAGPIEASVTPNRSPIAPGPSRAASSEPRTIGPGDTVGLRWRNLEIALTDALRSPLIGLGPDTFGQRYIEPTCSCPSHIPNQLSATLYESGIVGFLALAGAIGWILVRGWQLRLYAYVAAIGALLIGFQFTDALRFASTWILLGALLGLVVAGRRSREGSTPGPVDTP